MSLAPSRRRATFRAPDAEAARRFDLTLAPGDPGDPGDPGEAVDPAPATAAPAVEDAEPSVSRSTFTPSRRDSAEPYPAEPNGGTDPGSAPSVDLPLGRRAPRHRVDRRGNRRPSSGSRRAATRA